MIAIGINKDSDGFMVAMAAVSTVHGLDFSLAMMTKMSDLSPVTSSLLIVMDNTATFHLFPASILHIEGFGVAIATVEGSSAVLRQFSSTIRIVCTPVRGRFGKIWDHTTTYWHVSVTNMHHTTINWFRSAVYTRFIQGIMPDFYIWCTKKMG